MTEVAGPRPTAAPERGRRASDTLKFALAALLVLLPGLLHAAAPVPTEVVPKRIPGLKPRSVVFILSDDHRYDALGFLGHQFAKTPVMDSLAATGGHLKNALVTTSLCSPSRASILTGLYTFRHRVIDNNRPIPAGTVYFPQDRKSVV